ncbi:MAG: HAD hydrolase-like protein [Clostridia bacterium]
MQDNKKKADNQKIIFTDCFNTLIGRAKTPNDVIYDWSVEINKTYHQFSPIEFFKLFMRSWRNYERFDIIEKENSEFLMDIKDIFNDIYCILQKYLPKNVTLNEFVELSYSAYFNAEHNSHYLKRNVATYLYKKKKQGCKIYLVSDFYCNKEIIEKWLKELNFDTLNIFEDIFVSCDLKKSKKTGSIYSEIIKMKNLNPKNITMIGDNLWSDGIMAHKAGLKTKSVLPQIRRDCKILRKSKQKIQTPTAYQQIFNDDITDTCYSNNAFPLFLFTKRLADCCKRKNISNLFFLAREGQFLKKIFDYYCNANNLNIKSHYIYVSRKSIINTSCKNYDESFMGLSNMPLLTCKNFLKSLNFNDNEINLIIKEANIKSNKAYLQFYKSKDFQSLITSKTFNTLYQKMRDEQRQSYTYYLQSFNVDIYKDGFYIVDSGWIGNMQRYLGNYFDKEINLQGFYIGNVNKHSVNKKLYGLLFATKLKGLGYQDKIFSYRRFNWEEFLRTETGSCKNYDTKTNLPILTNTPIETAAFYQYIEPLQNKIFEKFQRITKVFNTTYCDIDNVCMYMYYQMFKHTNKTDRTTFIEIQNTFFDGFGYFRLNYSLVSKTLRKFIFYVKDKLFVLKYAKVINKKRLF